MQTSPLPRLEPLRFVRTSALEVAYYEAGPPDGAPIILLHGFPYDIHSYVDVAPMLAGAGFRVLVPYLRGHAPTTFLNGEIPRTGQQAAIAADLTEFMDSLEVTHAMLAGYDWGARAACIVAAINPDRCTGILSVNGYLIQDLSEAVVPISPWLEAGFWYFYYFATERGRAGLAANRREIARVIWTRNSPKWKFSSPMLDRAAMAFAGPDYVDVVVHSYRHRLGLADGDPAYAELEAKLASQPPIEVPAVTLDGLSDGNFPATDGRGYAHYFIGAHVHRTVARAGHNLPQERPEAFVNAVLELDELCKSTKQEVEHVIDGQLEGRTHGRVEANRAAAR